VWINPPPLPPPVIGSVSLLISKEGGTRGSLLFHVRIHHRRDVSNATPFGNVLFLADYQKKSSWHYGRRTDEDVFNAHEKSLLKVVFSVLFSFSLHRKML
jgi:hypothetical protein